MKDKNTNNSLKFNKFSLAALDGLDTFFNLSIVTYLSIFFSKLWCKVVNTNNIFRCFVEFFQETIYFVSQKILSKTKYIGFNLYFFFSFFYFIPIILIRDFNIISLVIFILCRILVGNLFYLGNTNYFLSDQFKNENNFFIKYISFLYEVYCRHISFYFFQWYFFK